MTTVTPSSVTPCLSQDSIQEVKELPSPKIVTNILQTPTENSEFLEKLISERNKLEELNENDEFSITLTMLNKEIERIEKNHNETVKYVDALEEKKVTISAKVRVPVQEHPKFNFVGKLLGPKGNSLKRLQEETLTKMTIQGKGSMRDKAKEKELRGTDPQYAHLFEDLHVDIQATAPAAEAYARIAFALVEIRKYLVPDKQDQVSLQQQEEMDMIRCNGRSRPKTNARAIDQIRSSRGRGILMNDRSIGSTPSGGPRYRYSFSKRV